MYMYQKEIKVSTSVLIQTDRGCENNGREIRGWSELS
jgi:hypothetical protein